MRPADLERLAKRLRSRVPGMAVKIHSEPPAVLRGLPNWNPRIPWPKLVAGALGLRGLAVLTDGRWACEGEQTFRPAPTRGPLWIDRAATQMVEAMRHADHGEAVATPQRELALRLSSLSVPRVPGSDEGPNGDV